MFVWLTVNCFVTLAWVNLRVSYLKKKKDFKGTLTTRSQMFFYLEFLMLRFSDMSSIDLNAVSQPGFTNSSFTGVFFTSCRSNDRVLSKPPPTDPPTHKPRNSHPPTHQPTDRLLLRQIRRPVSKHVLHTIILENFTYCIT